MLVFSFPFSDNYMWRQNWRKTDFLSSLLCPKPPDVKVSSKRKGTFLNFKESLISGGLVHTGKNSFCVDMFISEKDIEAI